MYILDVYEYDDLYIDRTEHFSLIEEFVKQLADRIVNVLTCTCETETVFVYYLDASCVLWETIPYRQCNRDYYYKNALKLIADRPMLHKKENIDVILGRNKWFLFLFYLPTTPTMKLAVFCNIYMCTQVPNYSLRCNVRKNGPGILFGPSAISSFWLRASTLVATTYTPRRPLDKAA